MFCKEGIVRSSGEAYTLHSETHRKVVMRHKLDIHYFETITSTNTELKKLGEEGAPEGTVLVANEQTAGKGRQGRSFYSPKDTGIYMSILLRPGEAGVDALFITTAAGIAVAEAIREVSGIPAGIKWVNDVYINDKKVCGILAEASLTEKAELKYVVLGIGINVSTKDEDFPEEIGGVASSIDKGTGKFDEAMRKRLIEEVWDRFMDMYEDIISESTDGEPGNEGIERVSAARASDEEAGVDEANDGKAQSSEEGAGAVSAARRRIADRYRQLSIMIGRRIRLLEQSGETEAFAEDIDDECHLIVRMKDGTRRVLSSGEVSTRV